MRNLDELPAFHPAGSANLLLHVAHLSNAQYIEQAQPARGSLLNYLLIGMAIGALATAAVLLA